ncbi:hypothetical protein EIN_223920 [Entamoeba invadens IP1]|uniref:RRM domain-containing protein n=1 Tax=Entamoeba invadens IP1 TaxID=370355 RepID=A0A0A1U2B3_ENTIV|nr:hypothetical protein EIN_223920 [Entamoeba invadens IP1]ELP88169.1 hypothetical protein EIN_223920 [Entamoeba invadens IP1]|eukprot:XP_004254940.1 hypothetical protein EIN_223920 [Entamoeba invadens IP1]
MPKVTFGAPKEQHENIAKPQKEFPTPSRECVSSGPMHKRLFIGGIDRSITQQQLKEQFKRYGTVESIEFKDKEEKDTLFAYMEFNAKNDLALHQCLSSLNMLNWKGHKLTVQYARDDIMVQYREMWKENMQNDTTDFKKKRGLHTLIRLKKQKAKLHKRELEKQKVAQVQPVDQQVE